MTAMGDSAAASERSEIGSRVRAFALRSYGILICRLALLAIVLGYWQFGTSKKVQFWTSTPYEIFEKLADWIIGGTLWLHLGATLTAMTLGYLTGCVVGIASGLVLGFWPRVNRLLSPFIAGLYALPKIALAPLFIIMLGIGLESKVALVALTVFFLLLNSTRDGVRDVDEDLLITLKLMGSTSREAVQLVVLPATLPWIFTGMRISVRYAFTGTLLAELIGSNKGIGYLIESSSGNFDATGAYAGIVVLIVFSVTMTEVLSLIEKRLDYRLV